MQIERPDRAAAERAGGIDGHNTDGLALCAIDPDHLIDQRALPGAGRSRQPQQHRVPAVREQRLQQFGRFRRVIFNGGNGPRQHANLSSANAADQVFDVVRRGTMFANGALKTPPSKDAIIAEAEKEVTKQNKFYQRGIITDEERYNKVLDAWTHARERITAEMMEALRNDHREGEIYLNPIFLMAESGARGGVEQIRQLAGMRGLMAKPSGKIIETPIKANFREGLSVLEYFSSTHGAERTWPTRPSRPPTAVT